MNTSDKQNSNPNLNSTPSSANDSSTSKRKLLAGLAIGGALVAGKSLPEQWTKPLINSVLLPAHAQATNPVNALAITPEENCGASVSFTVGIGVQAVVTPNPGAGQDIVFTYTCNGAAAGTFTEKTDTSGSAVVSKDGANLGCNPGDSLALVVTFLTFSQSCNWTMT